jgi:outer membrane protein OmpA-like peptidoglycan-associated protein
MRLLLRLTLPLLMLLPAAGCVPLDLSPPRLQSTPDRPAEKSVSAQLAYGYGLLADYDDYIANDGDAAAHFRGKAAKAASGAVVPPDPAAGGDTGTALGMLLQARQNLTAGHHTDFAEAQLNYDCWVNRLDRRDKSAALCRGKFYKAFARLGVAVAPQAAQGQEQHFSIYFRKGKAIPEGRALIVIRQAAAAFIDSPDWRIHLTGHAFGEKNKRADVLLSMRRAIAVRNILLQNGIDADRIVIGAVGATGAGRETSGGESESGSVDIAVVRVDNDQPDVGPDIMKIAPQYFGKTGPDL